MRLRRVRRRARVESGRFSDRMLGMMQEKERHRMLRKVDLPETIKLPLTCIKKNRISINVRSIAILHVIGFL